MAWETSGVEKAQFNPEQSRLVTRSGETRCIVGEPLEVGVVSACIDQSVKLCGTCKVGGEKAIVG